MKFTSLSLETQNFDAISQHEDANSYGKKPGKVKHALSFLEHHFVEFAHLARHDRPCRPFYSHGPAHSD